MSAIRLAFCYIYAPCFFIGFLGLALAIVDLGLPKFTMLQLLVVAIAISFLAERLAPFEPSWNTDKGDQKRDWMHALINETSNVGAIASLPLIASLGLGYDLWPKEMPLSVQLFIAIIIADLGISLTHYASHKVELLWRLHAVHHSVERMYGFNGLMKHPLHQSIELIAGTTPLLLIGIPLNIAALLGFSVAIQLLLQHSNVDMRLGFLGPIWAIAPGHRQHHRASKTEGDVNFGLFTLIWDHILGTYRNNNNTPRDGEIGIAGRSDYPVNYLDQFLEPFRAK